MFSLPAPLACSLSLSLFNFALTSSPSILLCTCFALSLVLCFLKCLPLYVQLLLEFQAQSSLIARQAASEVLAAVVPNCGCAMPESVMSQSCESAGVPSLCSQTIISSVDSRCTNGSISHPSTRPTALDSLAGTGDSSLLLPGQVQRLDRNNCRLPVALGREEWLKEEESTEKEERKHQVPTGSEERKLELLPSLSVPLSLFSACRYCIVSRCTSICLLLHFL